MEYTNAKVKSLAKALCLLDCFTAQDCALGITQLAERLDMNKSNVHNLVTTLQQFGYLERLPGGKYALGLKLLEFPWLVDRRLGYSGAVSDILNDAAAQTDRQVNFGLPYGGSVLYLLSACPRGRPMGRPAVGEKCPLRVSAAGKAILANLPQEQWPALLSQPQAPLTARTLTRQADILEDLHRTRRRGYAIDEGEHLDDLRGVGVPIYNAAGQLVAGLSADGPAALMADEVLLLCVKLLSEAALRIRERLYH